MHEKRMPELAVEVGGAGVVEPLEVWRRGQRRAVHEEEEADGTAVIGSSLALRAALRHLPAAVEGSAAVLLLGESGTGKELLARKIHSLGRRRDGAFVAVNCAAIPGELFESELFGHQAGAFSGALYAKRGLLEVADRGTVFLDEIGDLPPFFQVKLLRVLDDKEVRRLGETGSRKIDFRLICATNRNIKKEVEAGRFRHDLFYRINTFTLTLPPLRERGSDIPELAEHLVTLAADRLDRARPALSPAAIELLSGRHWPGNVRELANVIEKAVALASDRLIEPWHLGLEDSAAAPERRGALRTVLARVEGELVAAALAAHGGNVSAAARGLGVARQQLQRLMRRHRMGPRALTKTLEA